jgi:hypothetical protein
MASSINGTSTNNGGLITTGDDSGILNIQTNETTAIIIDASQRAAFVAGTAALPAITTDGDTNTGIWFPAADTIAFSEGGAEAMRINSAGDLLVNQTAVVLTGVIQFTFDGQNEQGMCIKNSANAQNGAAIRFIDYTNAYTGGGIYYSSSNSVQYVTSSDYRLKENIAPMTGALTKIQQLKPVTFSWKQDNSVSQGFIAHELQAVIPQAVNGTKDAVDKDGNPRYQGVDTSYIVATLTAAMQELKAINDTQAATINALTARIVALETV